MTEKNERDNENKLKQKNKTGVVNPSEMRRTKQMRKGRTANRSTIEAPLKRVLPTYQVVGLVLRYPVCRLVPAFVNRGFPNDR